MGFFDLFGGPDLSKQINQLGSLAGYSTGVGERDTTAASKFYTDILSGDPTRIAQSLAPEISAQQTQIQQAANKNAQFGTRSGGNTAATAGAEAAGRGDILKELGGLQTHAAQGAAGLGTSNLGMAASDINSQTQTTEQQYQDLMNSILGGAVTSGVNAGMKAIGI